MYHKNRILYQCLRYAHSKGEVDGHRNHRFRGTHDAGLLFTEEEVDAPTAHMTSARDGTTNTANAKKLRPSEGGIRSRHHQQ